MSYEDTLPILKKLLYEQKDEDEDSDDKVYDEDEFITLLCNEQILHQLGYELDKRNFFHDYTKYYCYMKNNCVCYSFMRG